MCLKRSGPNKIPPYHLDTITMTLRTSRICEKTKSKRNVKATRVGRRQEKHWRPRFPAGATLVFVWEQLVSVVLITKAVTTGGAGLQHFMCYWGEMPAVVSPEIWRWRVQLLFQVVVHNFVPVTATDWSNYIPVPLSDTGATASYWYSFTDGRGKLIRVPPLTRKTQSVLWLDWSHPDATFNQALILFMAVEFCSQ